MKQLVENCIFIGARNSVKKRRCASSITAFSYVTLSWSALIFIQITCSNIIMKNLNFKKQLDLVGQWKLDHNIEPTHVVPIVIEFLCSKSIFMYLPTTFYTSLTTIKLKGSGMFQMLQRRKKTLRRSWKHFKKWITTCVWAFYKMQTTLNITLLLQNNNKIKDI